MSRMREVAYVGLPRVGGLALGDRGRVLAEDGSCVHVRWASGALSGQVTPIDFHDVADQPPARRQASASEMLQDSLSVPALTVTGARETYDAEGEAGLLTAMAEAGLLAGLSQAAEEALEAVAARVRTDDAVHAVLASLEPEEADSLVSLAASALLRDAVGGVE